MQKNLKRGTLLALAAVGTLALTAVPASANSGTLYSPAPLAGWGQDGTAYAVAIAGGNVYAGGSFLNAVKNAPTSPRTNLMAVSESTGDLLDFRADTNGTVRALAADSTWLYVGGEFTSIQGVPVSRLARVSLSTGDVDPTFKPSIPKRVRGLAVHGTDLYVVGDFGKVGTTVRKRAAAIKTTDGTLEAFNPNLNARAYAVTVAGTRVYIGGAFTTVGGTARSYLAAVDAVSGALLGPAFSNVGDVILGVSVSDDGTQVFAAGDGGFNSAAAWNASTGARQWADRANGDVQAVMFSRGNVYFGFHDGFGGNTKLRLLAADAATGVVEPTFQPIAGGFPGVTAITADGTHLVAAGKFPKMGGVNVKGLSIHPLP